MAPPEMHPSPQPQSSQAASSPQQPPCHSSRGNAKTFLENEGLLYLNNRTPQTASYPGIKIFTGKENGSPYHTQTPPQPQPSPTTHTHTHSGLCPSHKAGLSGLYLDWGPTLSPALESPSFLERASRQSCPDTRVRPLLPPRALGYVHPSA